MERKEIRMRFWIEIDGSRFFGPGRIELLTLIEEEGSITKAAKKMGMSYKKAWDMVNDLNNRGSNPYVILRKGGEKGGGASVTENGKNVIAHYQHVYTKLQQVMEEEKGKILPLI